jgi:SAM-dependent methyltransferase
MTLREQMDKIYRELTSDEIPWNDESPPDALSDLVESGWISPCDAGDVGCGAGNYAIWLASKGFRMTGLDLSPNAIELAAGLAAQKGVVCRFMARDMTGAVEGSDKAFDIAGPTAYLANRRLDANKPRSGMGAFGLLWGGYTALWPARVAPSDSAADLGPGVPLLALEFWMPDSLFVA